jgi:hypothetical protein
VQALERFAEPVDPGAGGVFAKLHGRGEALELARVEEVEGGMPGKEIPDLVRRC